MDKKQLLDLKEEIDSGKEETSELKGKLKHLKDELKKDWACSSSVEGQKKKEKFKKEIEDFQEKIDKGSKELEEKYDFSTNS